MTTQDRMHALDAVRAFALLLGVAFHAAISFVPGMPPIVWAIADNSPSAALASVAFVSHMFRMTLFFFIAGFFARLLFQRRGTGGFWANRSQRILVPLIVGWVMLYPAIAAVWDGVSRRHSACRDGESAEDATAAVRLLPARRIFGSCITCCCCMWRCLQYAVSCVAADRAGRIRAAADKLVRGSLSGYGPRCF